MSDEQDSQGKEVQRRKFLEASAAAAAFGVAASASEASAQQPKAGGESKPGQLAARPDRKLTSRNQLSAMRAIRDLEKVGDKESKRRKERSLELGLEAAKSVEDRSISLFVRGDQPAFAGINTFAHYPYCENIRDVGQYDVAFVGAPLDCATTYRTGTRFGPQAVRRISATYDSYSPDMGIDLREELKICDAGDIFIIPANLEKSFDQIDLAVSHLHKNKVFPVICGGDHSI